MTTAEIESAIFTRGLRNEIKALVIDDDPMWRLMINKIIHSVAKKAEVHCVSTLESARALLLAEKSKSYDLIISDFQLDGNETGLDFWRKCQKSFSQIPFLLISGRREREFFNLMKKEETHPYYLAKPFDRNDFKLLLDSELMIPQPKKLANISFRLKLWGFAALLFTFLAVFGDFSISDLVASSPEVEEVTTSPQALVTPELKLHLNHALAQSDELHETTMAFLRGR